MKQENMTRWEPLTLLFAIKTLVEENKGAVNTPEQLPQTAPEPKGKQQEETKAQPEDDGEQLVEQTLNNKKAAEAEAAAKAKAAAEAAAKAKAEAKKKKPQTAGTKTPATTTTAPAAAGSLNLGYATYTGQTKNGKPHGKGKLVYKQERKIVASQSYTAAPGDTYEGQFRDGKVSGGPGVWTHNGVQTQINP